MIFVESPWFCAWRAANLDDEAYLRVQMVLIERPAAGDVIRGSGGLRKLRVALAGRGKRGGARVIYYWWASKDRCYLLQGYAKNVRGDLTAQQIKRLAAVMRKDIDDE
jgi:hypothetical protein